MRTPITRADLAPLVDQYGMSWHIWPSAQGWYACATRRKGQSVPRGRNPQTPGTQTPGTQAPGTQDTDAQDTDARPAPTLVEDSVAALAEALARETRWDRAPAARDSAEPA